MKSYFALNLENVALSDFRILLEKASLTPSRTILKESIREHIETLAKNSVRNLKQLSDELETQASFEAFQKKTGLQEQYLIALRREVHSLVVKPVSIDKIPGISQNALDKLKKMGVHHTKHLFDSTINDPAMLKVCDIIETELCILVAYADLLRIHPIDIDSVGLLYKSEITTSEELAGSAPEAIQFRIQNTINENKLPDTVPDLDRLTYWVAYARLLGRK